MLMANQGAKTDGLDEAKVTGHGDIPAPIAPRMMAVTVRPGRAHGAAARRTARMRPRSRVW